MTILVTVIILLACVVLGFIILIQNPKGGGLAGQFGTMGAQVMGVKQSTDVMEKGTWYTMAIIAGLSILAVTFYPDVKRTDAEPQRSGAPAGGGQQAPAGGAPTAPAQGGAPAGPAAPAPQGR
jgi:preprotein translocase subunit SecG